MYGFEKYNVQHKTATFVIYLPDSTEMSLHVTSATEQNKKYRNALLKATSSISNKKTTTSAQVDRILSVAPKLMAKHVVVGWENVKDDQGNDVAFTEENVAEFLIELRTHVPHIFTELVDFASDPYNFLPDDEDDIDAEELAKN